jgi:two-component system response regulator GlrR
VALLAWASVGGMLPDMDDQTMTYREAREIGTVLRRDLEISWHDASDAVLRKAIRSRAVVGTSPEANIVLSDRTVSRLHAELDPREDGLWIRDLGSHNGTFIQNIQIGSARLTGGTAVRVGRTELTVGEALEPTRVEVWPESRFGSMVGASIPMRELFARLARVSASPATVLIEGETGTGKELAAQAIHDASSRAEGPFVVVDCAALPEGILEAELFGHAKGAFTSASTARAGAIEEADGGTVFFDEIGELPLNLQPKLLRVLESRTVKRLGETRLRAVDVRFIAATHRDLRAMANNRAFREDLYFRLAVLPVVIPPLRERAGDLPMLLEHLLGGDATSLVSRELMHELVNRPWLGNVRELRNFVERLSALGADEALALTVQRPPSRASSTGWTPELPDELLSLPFASFRQHVTALTEREYLLALLSRHDRKVKNAAQEAGLNRTYFHRLMVKHRL